MNDGEILYHYTSAEAFLNIINGRSLWATDAAYLNDPSELVYAFEQLPQAVDRLDDPEVADWWTHSWMSQAAIGKREL